ncbi:MAG TPA: UbiH/UbiF/VisC/COQ6 family ubiquinone biosynthesis hydroxylase [Rhizomicrobium sp.]|jgi:2-octaprenyl-6-methoxyphenol hydroxylase|nr:UbiH/UbiF/VisC/COQ6 family ubiquinone biosynthesis hydroxylase [Rhizomicrobium sp.]
MNDGPSLQPDVLIAGGGMIGLTLALALARDGISVAVADPIPEATVLNEGFDGRVSALSYAVIRMLKVLGIWAYFESDAQPIFDILVTDAAPGESPSPFSLHFDHREIGEPMGAIAENRHIRRALFAAIHETKTVRVISPAAVLSVATSAEFAESKLSNGETVRASLVVAADGRNSPLREQMGIRTISWSYPQIGIVATVQHSKPHNGTAYEHFLPSGPFAILPMTGNRSSLVWTERQDLAPALLQLPPEKFEAEIAKRFGDHLGEIEVIGARWSYPLQFHLARRYVAPRFALAGDSAHGIHPIAGQGLNLGLKDAAALTECLLESVRLGLDAGAGDALRRYERWRRFDSFMLAAATDGLNRLFSNDIAPIRAVRDLGLGIVDAIGPLRRLFMRNAGGDLGKLPRLMQGEAA